MKSNAFVITPIPPDVTRALRERMADDAGNPLVPRRDDARHQCRSCLRLTEPGEPYLAVSYAPMAGKHPFVERGPIYIHERACEPYSDASRYPAEFPRKAVVLRAYGETNEIEDARFVGETAVEDAVGELLANPAIRYVHARNATYGCFMFKIERGGDRSFGAARG